MRSPLQQAMDRIGSAAIWTPATLFASGEQGVWYDPSDFSTLFQDSAGNTPVTAAGQVVGLMLDKSKGMVLGSELLTVAANRDFSSDTGFWTKAAGVVISGGQCVFTAVGDTQGFSVNNLAYATPGQYYEVVFTIASISAGAVRIYLGSPAGTLYTVAGTYTQRVLCGGNNYFGIVASGTTTCAIDNISLKKVTGNHATQATTASKPVLQQDGNGKYYLAFDGVDDGMATSAVDFTATDKMGVFAGARINSAALGVLLETSADANTNVGAFNAYFNDTGTYGIVSRANKQGSPTWPGEVSIGSANTSVWSIDYDFTRTTGGQAIYERRNGAAYANGGSFLAGVEKFGAYPLYIGSRNGATLRFNGRIYQLIIRGALTDAAGITAAETFVNSKTAAY